MIGQQKGNLKTTTKKPKNAGRKQPHELRTAHSATSCACMSGGGVQSLHELREQNRLLTEQNKLLEENQRLRESVLRPPSVLPTTKRKRHQTKDTPRAKRKRKVSIRSPTGESISVTNPATGKTIKVRTYPTAPPTI